MTLYWTCKEEDLTKIPNDIKYYLENDWLLDNEGTIVFQSLDDTYKAIKSIYPLATYDIKIKDAFITIENFDSHLWELKEYRK